MEIDRVELNRLLAKAIAYKQAGNDSRADDYARGLIDELVQAGILEVAP